ncbi:MAG TPA: NAD(P)-dependent oxidoreductase [Aestuariivirgaceae bacterium]|jgi:3-hydroxyisobutyrate dehydrogenase-like beta-hydroxyacid dehydrogenase
MSEKKQVGLIGAGLMGHGIGKNILEKGYALAVLAHRNRKPVEDLLSKGANEAKSPRELAQRSDVVILCVTGSPQVEQVIYGPDGLLEGMRPGLIIADCSTAEPQSTMRISADVTARGGHFVDTPMTRTPKEAEAGKLALMTGGDGKILAEIAPILSCFADTIVHAGDVGAAHKLKLINNFIALGTAAIVAEGMAAAAKAGVDMEALREVVTAGGANSVMFERIIKVALADDDTAAKFAIENAAKDLRYYTSMTETLPVVSFIGEAVHQTYVLAETMGYGKRYVPRLVDLHGEINRVKVRKR